MHVSGLIKRSLAQVMGGTAGAQVAAAKPAAKKSEGRIFARNKSDQESRREREQG